MVSNKTVICLLLVGVFCFAQLTVAKPAQAYGMDVVFKDMGFGLLIGTIMAGLIMGTNAENIAGDQWVPGLAIGGAVGASIGLGVGMVSTYKTAMISYDRKEGLAFNLPTIKSTILADKATVSVLQYKF